MIVVAALAGMLVTGGVWVAATSWRSVPVTSTGASRGRWARLAGVDRVRLAAAAVAGLAALVWTRWPVAAVGAGVAGWALAGMRDRRERRAESRSEAIALWTEMLRDALGTARGVEGVLIATVSAAPSAIRPEVERMAQRLRHEPLDSVLDGLADDLADPVGDLVVTALRLSSSAGGRRAREVLGDLAAAAYTEADAQRRVAVSRQRPIAAMRYTTIVIVGFVALLLVFSRSYLEPYGTAVGQVVLALVGCYWTAGVWWMAHMAHVPRPARVLHAAEVGR